MRKDFNRITVVDVWNKTGGRCWYCALDLREDDDNGLGFSIDHINPISKFSDNSIDNLVPCCRTCNSKKGNKSIEEFRVICSKQYNINDYIFYFEAVGLS